MDDKVVFAGFNGEYDPKVFLRMVATEAEKERKELVASITIILDANGGLTLHTSTTDFERNFGLVSTAQAHLLGKLHEAYTYGFEGGPQDAA